MELKEILDKALELGASDLHLAAGEVPRVRLNGELVSLGFETVSEKVVRSVLQFPDNPSSERSFTSQIQLDVLRRIQRTMTYMGRSFLCTFFVHGTESTGVAIRIAQAEVPSLDRLSYSEPHIFARLLNLTKGLILIGGPLKSGKWTVINSIVDEINQQRASRIFVFEPSPSYSLASKLSLVSQVPINAGIGEWSRRANAALLAASLSDADVVAIDDIYDSSVLRTLIGLAEKGKLVIASVQADSVIDLLERVLELIPEGSTSLTKRFAKCLHLATCQELLPTDDGRIPIIEWIGTSDSVREAIENRNFDRLRSIQETADNCRTREASLKANLSQT